jgi:alpha-amylase
MTFYTLRADYGAFADSPEREKIFAEVLSEAHRYGMKVFIDLPINHISIVSKWFTEAQKGNIKYIDYFLWAEAPRHGWRVPWDPESQAQDVWHYDKVKQLWYYALFGWGMPDLNHKNPAVQEEFTKIFRKYAQLGVDGFRIDAAKHLVEGNDNLDPVFGPNIQRLNSYLVNLRSEFPDQSFLLEIWNDYSIIEPYLPGAGDVAFDFPFMTAVRDSLIHKHPWAVRKKLQHFISRQREILPGQRIVFASNHDVPRLRTSFNEDMRRAQLAAVLTMTLPQIPLLYYGEEIFMPGRYVRYPQAQAENNIVEVCTPMAWSPDKNAGFTAPETQLGNAWNRKIHADYKTFNVKTQSQYPGSLLNLYKTLIHLRKNLNISNTTQLSVINNDSDVVLSYSLGFDDGNCMIALINFGEETLEREIPEFKNSCQREVIKEHFTLRAKQLNSGKLRLGPMGVWIGNSSKPSGESK